MIKNYFQQYYLYLLISICSLLIFFIVINSSVSHTESDPRGSLLLAQNIIKNKTIRLDNYASSSIINLECDQIKPENVKPELDICRYPMTRIQLEVNFKKIYAATMHKKHEHLYYYFPIGSSISSIPFVLFGVKIFDANMENAEQDSKYQKIIAAVVSALIFITLVSIAKNYLNNFFSIGVAIVFWLGTSFSSTLGQALWMQNFATLYTLLAIYLMLKIVKFNKNSYWILLGFILFMAYLTRPTLSLLSIAVISYIFCKSKKVVSIKTACLVGIFLGIFILFSFYEFQQILPDYYMPKRFHGQHFGEAFFGHLFSPARGLFSFSPFLILFFLNPHALYSIFLKNKSLICILSWCFIHLIIISRFHLWWGGHSYGSRLIIDILPALYLIFVTLFSEILLQKKWLNYRFNILFLIITVPVSVYFNTIQGLYNQYSGTIWNNEPDIDAYPEYLFNWKYPQFLHNEERHNARLVDFKIKNLTSISIEDTYTFDSKNIIYIGWSNSEKDWRWSLDNSSKLLFKLENHKQAVGILKLHIGTLGEQRIKVAINNHPIGMQKASGHNIELTFQFTPDVLKANKLNTISFEFPDAYKPENGDPRILAIALKSFTLE